jgi:hypothetical protein
MTNHTTHSQPAATLLALRLAAVVSFLPSSDSLDHHRLYRIADLLSARTPQPDEALAETLRGVAGAIQPGRINPQPETWLLCGVAALLGGDLAEAAALARAAPGRPVRDVPAGAVC